jgi:CRP-like cAMP-binding protein
MAILKGLDDSMLERCEELFEEKFYTAGSILCHEGEMGNQCFLVASGQVSVSKLIDPDEDAEKIVASLKEGDLIGEMTLIEEMPRSATVSATTDVRVFVISREAFRDLLVSNPDGAVKLLLGIISTLSGRLRRSTTELIALYDTGKIVGSVTELSKLCSAIIERLVESLGMKKGLIFLTNEYIPQPQLKGSYGYSVVERHGLKLDAGKGILGHMLSNRSPLLFNSFSPPQGLSLHGFEDAKMLGVPLMVSDKTIGAIVLCGADEGLVLDMNHLNLLVGVSSQVANAIENARLREEESARQAHDRHFVRY